MSRFGAPIVIADMDSRDVNANKLMPWGTKQESIDGKLFRYGNAGSVNLTHARICVAPAAVANHTNKAVSEAAAVGARVVKFTLGNTAVAVGDYADGQLLANDATGEGYSYDLKDTNAAAGLAVVTCKLNEPIKEAFVASTSEVSLVANPWYKAIVSPSAIAHRPIGVTVSDITATYSGFFQTRGDCPVLADGVISKGADAILSDATDGAVEIAVDATIVKRVGYAPAATVSTEHQIICLTLE